ncbi:MAG: PHP domain-containing protein [Bacilli bacterium]|nr:PHP domain-containing protein [Bacilli bacterium]MDD4481907.1 PHP domain-containing protein [Bacilli bacterium]MDD5182670.1 PHP domain-containing protein [Bacilli bacterium]
MRGDFHMHSTHSDGKLTVEEVIQEVKNKGLSWFSITDHDNLDGSLNAIELANKNGLNLIVGLELSTFYNNESIHVLGYFPTLDKIHFINSFLHDMRVKRKKRAFNIKDKLFQHFNIDLNMERLEKMPTITRASISSEIIRQGYPYTKKEIFERFIGADCPAYIPSTNISTQIGIDIIKKAGGYPVIAHPVLYKKTKITELIKMGITGIEAIYPANSSSETLYYKKIAKDENLFITAGSDFHDFDDYKHGNIGDCYLEGEDLKVFLEKLGKS